MVDESRRQSRIQTDLEDDFYIRLRELNRSWQPSTTDPYGSLREYVNRVNGLARERGFMLISDHGFLAQLGPQWRWGDTGAHALGLKALDQAAEGFQREFNFDKSSRRALNSKFRDHRDFISAVAERDVSDRHVSALDGVTKYYSAALQKPAQKLISVLGETALEELIGSYLHMTNNRVFQDNARIQELVVYDLLRRGIKGLRARQKYARKSASESALRSETS